MLEILRHLSDSPKDSIFGKSNIEEFPDATVATIRSWMQEGGEWVAGLEIMKIDQTIFVSSCLQKILVDA